MKNCDLYNGNCLSIMKKLKKSSIDMIFADPPYFLSNNGITCNNGKMVSVNKGKWDSSKGLKEDYRFNKQWIMLCKKLLKPNGTIWISGTYHNIYMCGYILQELGFKIINDISWFKPNASPNLSCKCFTASTETILWATKNEDPKYTFNYNDMKFGSFPKDFIKHQNKQMRNVWVIPTTTKKEKVFGKHPTQKPIELLDRIIRASTKEGDVVLDPFMGSGTTGVVAIKNKRQFVGIELEKEYFELSEKRIRDIEE